MSFGGMGYIGEYGWLEKRKVGEYSDGEVDGRSEGSGERRVKKIDTKVGWDRERRGTEVWKEEVEDFVEMT